MTIKTSTGLRNKMLDTGSAKTILALGFVKIYSGAVPADADAALGAAVLLTTISNNATATGLTMAAAASGGILSKTVAEVWSGVNAASGAASFYRHTAVGDDGLLSTTQARVQGTVATAGADMNISSTALTAAATQAVDFYTLSLPTA